MRRDRPPSASERRYRHRRRDHCRGGGGGARRLPGLLLTAEMVGEPKVARLTKLMAEAPDTLVVVDNLSNVDELQRAAEKAGV